MKKIGISFFLVWENNFGAKTKKVLAIYLAQLSFNLFWSLLFFGSRNPWLALIEIFILWALILLNLVIFHKISKPAGYLLLPYLFWVSFATVLNLSIVRLNY